MPNAPATKRGAGGWQGNRVAVIGCGFIGSHIVSELADNGRPPIVLTRSRPGDDVLALIDHGDLHLGDAADPETVEHVLDGVGHIVYSAGGLLPAASEQDPERDAELTLEPVRTVLCSLRRRPGVKLTYVSSGGTVYGEPEHLPVSEDAPARPLGTYGKLHLICEEEIDRHRREDGLRARILRCSTVYGEHQLPNRGQGAIVTFLDRIMRQEPIELYGGGSTIRDYIYARDVASVLVQLLDRDDGPAILNVASGEGTSLIDLLRMAESQVGRPAQVVSLPERAFDVHKIILDITRLRSLVAFEPTPLEEGIGRTHRWLTSVEPSTYSESSVA